MKLFQVTEALDHCKTRRAFIVADKVICLTEATKLSKKDPAQTNIGFLGWGMRVTEPLDRVAEMLRSTDFEGSADV